MFRRTVAARVTQEVARREPVRRRGAAARPEPPGRHRRAHELELHPRLPRLHRGTHRARQSELHGLYHIASALGRSLDVNEIAEVGLRETLKVLGLQAGAVWVREGARLKLAKTIGMQPGEEEEFSRPDGRGSQGGGDRLRARPNPGSTGSPASGARSGPSSAPRGCCWAR